MFLESIWISAFTKWLLTFGGKAARIVLIICTLYMSAELYPGVTLPASLNIAVFIVLNFALDMGGLGLAQIAKTARNQGNTEGAEQGELLAKWLIGIMIAGLVTVSLEHAADMLNLKGDLKNYVAVFWIFVEIALSIARVICAVNYGHVVHALERSVEDAKAQEHDHQEELQNQIAQLQRTLQSERRQATDVQAQLQKDLQSARADFTFQIEALKQSQNMTLQTAENQSSVVNDLQNQLREALQQVRLQTAKLDEKQRTVDLQNEKLQTATTDLQSAKLQIANLQNHLQEAKLQTAKMPAVQTAKPPASKITSLDQARAKHEAAGSSRAKVSDEEILAFRAANPNMTASDVANHFGISVSKVNHARPQNLQKAEGAGD
jgi:hypothetical protein